MGQSPFAKRAASTDLAGASNRRSTRVDYACSIVVSGRDATGQSFREETETCTVNLHGCKLRTEHQVLVGMMVSIECPATQASAKGVCVHVFDPSPGETAHEIAVQLVKPQNMWGLKNPPPDWEAVAQEMVKGRRAPLVPGRLGDSPPPPPAPASPPPVVPPLAGSLPLAKVAAATFEPPFDKPGAGSEVERQGGFSDAEMQLGILEQRAALLMESVLQILRTEAEEFVRDTVDTFRQQVAALVKAAKEEIQKRAEKTYEDVEGSLMTLRGDLAEQLSQRTEQIVANTEEALRAKVGEMFATMLKPTPKK